MGSLLRLRWFSSSVARISTCFRWQRECKNVNLKHCKTCECCPLLILIEWSLWMLCFLYDGEDGEEWNFQVYLFQWREFGLCLASQQVLAELNKHSCHHHNHTHDMIWYDMISGLCSLSGLHSWDNVLCFHHRLRCWLHVPVQLAAHWLHPRPKLNRCQIFQGYQHDLFGLRISSWFLWWIRHKSC